MNRAETIATTIGALCAMALLGCAGLSAERDSLDGLQKRGFLFAHKSKGFRYYQPATFILLHTDNNGGVVTKVLTLPDTTQPMSVRPYSYFASNDAELTFEKGILGSAKSNADATAVPKAVIAVAEQVLKAAAGAGALLDEDAQAELPRAKRRLIPGPYLFKLVTDERGVRLVGSQGMTLEVALPSKADKKDEKKAESAGGGGS